ARPAWSSTFTRSTRMPTSTDRSIDRSSSTSGSVTATKWVISTPSSATDDSGHNPIIRSGLSYYILCQGTRPVRPDRDHAGAHAGMNQSANKATDREEDGMAVPKAAKYIVIGAGVHGLSTAYHLGRTLREKGQGSGTDIVVLEKKRAGAGASGIACGVVRNFYFQPAMNEIVRLSVAVWEEHAGVLGYHPVGYIAAAPAPQAPDLVAIGKRHAEIGY